MTARRNRMWWRAVLIIAGLLALTGMSAVARPASATVLNWQIVSASSPSTSDHKGVTVTCPDGTQRLAAGADVFGAGRDVVIIDNLIPGSHNVGAYAYEYQYGTTEAWSIRAWAVCGNVGSTVYTYSQTSDANVDAYKEVTVSCPNSMVVLGTGFRLDGAEGHALVHTVTPTRDSITVKAYEVDLNIPPGLWSATAYAICADDPGGRSQVSYTTVSNSDTLKLGLAPCPEDTKGFGAGFELKGFQGRLNLPALLLTEHGVVTIGG